MIPVNAHQSFAARAVASLSLLCPEGTRPVEVVSRVLRDGLKAVLPPHSDDQPASLSAFHARVIEGLPAESIPDPVARAAADLDPSHPQVMAMEVYADAVIDAIANSPEGTAMGLLVLLYGEDGVFPAIARWLASTPRTPDPFIEWMRSHSDEVEQLRDKKIAFHPERGVVASGDTLEEVQDAVERLGLQGEIIYVAIPRGAVLA